MDTRRFAVIVGINEYADPSIPNLGCASADAQAIYQVLTDPARGGIPTDNARLLLDEEATHKNIKSAIATWLSNLASAEDTVVIFFAGHGAPALNVRSTAKDGMEKYLVPFDGEVNDLRATGIAMQEINRWFDFLESKRVLFLIDSCYSGVASSAEGRTFAQPQFKPRAILSEEFLDDISGEGRTVITACDVNELSLEATNLNHGVFTHFLVEGMLGQADADGDGRVGVDELYQYVFKNVEQYSRNLGSRMRPVRRGETRGDFYLTQHDGKDSKPFNSQLGSGAHNPRQENAQIDRAQQLRQLRNNPNLDQLPFIFDSLLDADDQIRERAMQVLLKMGWGPIGDKLEDIGRSDDVSGQELILRGMSAIGADDESIRMIQRLGHALSGRMRQRAIELAQKKQLTLAFEELTQIFEEHRKDYELERVLGVGLFASSYLARNRSTNAKSVIRVLNKEMALRDDVRNDFLDLSQRSTLYVHQKLALTREARAIPEHKIFYCVRDFVEGRLLQNALDSSAHIPATDTHKIVSAVAEALTVIHKRGESHGGVKPGNIYLTDDDEVVLGDPSLKLALVPPGLERVIYDYQYASPEAFSNQEVLPCADIYAIGCVGLQLLTGRVPYQADDVYRLVDMHRSADLPALSCHGDFEGALEQLFHRCLSKDPSRRPEDAFRFLDALTQISLPSSDNALVPEATTVLIPEFEEDEFRTQIGIFDVKDIERTVFKPLPASASSTPSVAPIEPTNTQTQAPLEPSMAAEDDSTSYPAANERTPLADNLNPGDIIGDRFVVDSVLGQGGMSTVYKCKDLRLVESNYRDPFVAVKVLASAVVEDSRFVVALQRETRKTQSLRHPNIVQVYDFDRDAEQVYMTMEVVEGVSLAEYLKDYPSGMSFEDAWPIIQGISAALTYAHEHGIVHSDFKPANCYVTPNGEVKVLDFGIARAASEPEDEQDSTLFDVSSLGALTPAFASLEQLNNVEPHPKDDIYALGCIVYMMLTGEHPFNRVTASEASTKGLAPSRIPGITQRQHRAIEKALSFTRAERIDTTLEFVEALDPMLQKSSGQNWLWILVAIAAVGGLLYFGTFIGD